METREEGVRKLAVRYEGEGCSEELALRMAGEDYKTPEEAAKIEAKEEAVMEAQYAADEAFEQKKNKMIADIDWTEALDRKSQGYYTFVDGPRCCWECNHCSVIGEQMVGTDDTGGGPEDLHRCSLKGVTPVSSGYGSFRCDYVE